MSGLYPFFERFCENFDKKLRWSKMKGDPYTKAMLEYFEGEGLRQNFRPEPWYMTLDMVWWSPLKHLALALEHENPHNRTTA